MFDVRLLIALLSAVLLPLSASADDLQPEDFAWGQHLLTDGSQPFYRLPLPPAIYGTAAHADLRDLRIFNNAGETLPFALVTTPRTSKATETSSPLHAFALPGEKKANGSGRLSVKGELELSWSMSEESKKPQLLLVVPGADARRTLSSIRLHWAPAADSWQQQVSIESSDDLEQWTELAREQPLMDLRQSGQQLRIDRVSFPESTARYWRLTLDGNHMPKLQGVDGIYQANADTTAIEWLPATHSSADEDDEGRRIYRFALAQPAAFLRFRLPQENSVLPYTLDYRRHSKEAWQALPAGVAWRLTLDGRQQESPWQDTSGVEIGELRVGSRSGWAGGAPGIELGRQPAHLVFNARGKGPWLLAWGSAAATHAALPASTLIPEYSEQELMEFPEATAADTLTLGGEQRRLEPGRAQRQAQWQTRGLWFLLILGAGALAWLALKLWHDMPKQESQD